MAISSTTITETDSDEPTDDRDRAVETTASGDIKATANGNLFTLPAGDASTTITLGGSTAHLDSQRRASGLHEFDHSLGRTTGEAAINLDLPISRRNQRLQRARQPDAERQCGGRPALRLRHADDAWRGRELVAGRSTEFLCSWTREDGPPTINQLGDPVLVTPDTRIFDFVTGQTVLVTATTGGNPNLQSDMRNVFKLGGELAAVGRIPICDSAPNMSTRRSPTQSQSITVTPTIEAAFPDSFVRDDIGQLVSVDLRPVNFESSERDTLRIGFDFSKPLKSQPAVAGGDRPDARAVSRRCWWRWPSQTNGASTDQTNRPPPGPPPAGGAPPAGGLPRQGEQQDHLRAAYHRQAAAASAGKAAAAVVEAAASLAAAIAVG